MKGLGFVKKVLSLALVCAMLLSFAPCIEAADTNVMPMYLDGEWDFKYYANASMVPSDVVNIEFEDKIQVPGAMELQGYGTPGYYYEEMPGWGMPEDDGVKSAGVYKTTFSVSKGLAGDVKLVFDSVMDNLTVYLNGQKLNESRNGAIGTVYDLNLKESAYTLVCVVERDKSGINKKDDFALSGIMGRVYIAPYSVYSNSDIKGVEIKENTLYINGKEVLLKGVKYTVTNPYVGNAVTDGCYSDLSAMKEMGFNAVWTSCAPDEFYRNAEKLGFYVIDEANIYLGNAERDMETAKKRVEETVNRHKQFKSIIMWSVGCGSGNWQSLIDIVKKLDSRPVAQEAVFAPEFKVFGNTGGMATWIKELGKNNIGGFVDEFADKELYYTQPAYVFDAKDQITGEAVTIDGEIINYKGADMLGEAFYTRSVEPMERFTLLTYISNANRDRVIFETVDKSIRLETIDYRIRLTVNGQIIEADGGEGKAAAVYADGEMQLFTSRSFKGNMQCDAQLSNGYTVGEGDGGVGIEYIKLYNDALTIDELIEGNDEKLISSLDFKNIDIKKDKSYKFLAYGGDFGDEPNSYYKCLTGLYSSTREIHPEGEAFKALLTDAESQMEVDRVYGSFACVEPVMTDNYAVFTLENRSFAVDFDGNIISITDGGVELLSEPMRPSVFRDNTLSEYETGYVNYEGWRAIKAEAVDNVLYIELISTVTEGRLYLSYSLSEAGFKVSVQTAFADEAEKPTFIGFKGAGNFERAEWYGSKTSSYPDRVTNIEGLYTLPIKDMSDNYAVPQENGNRIVYTAKLEDAEDNMLGFAASDGKIHFAVHDYSSEAMDYADHDEDIVKEDKAYFRVGGYIAGVSDNREYKLNDNVYGFDFYIVTKSVECAETPNNPVRMFYIDGEKYKAFSQGVKTYVYRTNKPVIVTAEGTAEVTADENKATAGDYTIYFAPDNEYLSDMEGESVTAQIAKDSDFNGNAITMRGTDFRTPPVTYDKGVTIKNGSITYDVSGLNSHTFNAVIGKNEFNPKSFGGGFDRNMFQASGKVTISLDGKVVYEKEDVSMRSQSEEVNIDVSNAKSMTITVTANGQANNYSDAAFANAVFVPKGPVVLNFEKKNGKATLTLLNTDKEKVDVVLTSDDNGIVTSAFASVKKGLYQTIEVNTSESAKVSAVINYFGTIALE